MATVEKIVKILFKGDDQVSKVARSISKGVSASFEGLEAIAEPLAKVGEAVLGLNAALATLVTGALVVALDKTKELDSAQKDLAKVLKDGETITDSMTDGWKALSNEFGIAQSEIVASLAGLSESGYSAAEGMEVLQTSLKLSAASELEAEEATERLKRAMVGYEVSVNEADDIANVWNRTANIMNANVNELSSGFSAIARQAKNSGFSVEEFTAALASMIAGGESGSEAAGALSVTLSKLTDPTKEAEAAIRALTGAQGPLLEEFSSGKEIFEAVAKGLQTVDSQIANVYISQIAGADQAKRMQLAFSDYGKTLENIQKPQNQLITLENEVAIQLSKTETSVKRLLTGIDNALISLGQRFQEVPNQVVLGGIDITHAIESIISAGTFNPVIEKVKAFGDEIGKNFSDIAKLLPEAFKSVNFESILEAIDLLSESLGGIFDDVDLSTADGLSTVIQKVIDTIGSLMTVATGMIDSFKPLFDTIREGTERFNELEIGAKKSFGEVLAAAQLVTAAGAEIGLALVAIGKSGTDIKDAFDIVIGTFKTFKQGIDVLISASLYPLIEVIQYNVDAIGALADITGFDEFAEKARHASQSMQDFQEGIKLQTIEDVSDGIAGTAQAFDGLKGAASSSIDSIKGVSEAIEEIPEEATTEHYMNIDYLALLDVKEKVEEIPDKKEVDVGIDLGTFEEGVQEIKDFTPPMIELFVDKEHVIEEVEYVENETEKVKPTIEIKSKTDKESVSITKKELEEIVEKEYGVSIQTKLDKKAVDVTDEDLKEFVMRDRAIELGLDPEEFYLQMAGLDKEAEDLEKKLQLIPGVDMKPFKKATRGVKQEADVMKEALKLKAEVDIAQIEAAAKEVEAMWEGVSDIIESTGENITKLTDQMTEAIDTGQQTGDFTQKNKLLEQMEREAEIQEESFELAKKRTEQEIALMKSQQERIESGESALKIEIDSSVDPTVEEVIKSILEKVHVWGNETNIMMEINRT